MARLITCGYEAGPDHLAHGANQSVYGTDATRVTTNTPRSGDYSGGRVGTANFRWRWAQAVANGTAVYLRAYFRRSSTGSRGENDDLLWVGTAAEARIAVVRLNTNGSVSLLNSAAAALATSGVLAADTWHRVEALVMLAATPTTSNGTWELRIDGTTVASGAAANLGTTAIGTVLAGCWTAAGGTSNSDTVLLDDLAVNDSTGTAQTSWPGSGQVIHLHPTADFARSGFVDGAGGTTSLFAAVDNRPPTGVSVATSGATNQIESSAVKNITDNYEATLQTYTAAGIGASDTITLVQDVYSVAPNSANARSFGMTKTNNPSTAETTANSGNVAAGTHPTGWALIKGSISYAPSVTLGTAPRIKIRKNANVAEVAACDYMALVVEYVAAVVEDPRPRGIRQPRPQNRRAEMRTRRALWR